MSKKQDISLPLVIGSNTSPEAASSFGLSGLILPNEAKAFLLQLLSECNRRISFQLSTFPNAHEEALDLLFISHFASMQGAIKFGTHWTLRIDAHYIGGGRHYRTWEVADIGLMAMFRKNGRIVRSKLTFLQSKKLYASPLKLRDYDPYYRMGMGRLLVTEDEHREIVEPKLLKYSEASKYKALNLESEQQKAMKEFSSRYNITLHYLLYNPSIIPWEIRTPVERLPDVGENKVGCRVIPKALVDKMVGSKRGTYSPSYKDIRERFSREFLAKGADAGWRMEHFICELFIEGEEGLVDDSPNFQVMANIMSHKSSPISRPCPLRSILKSKNAPDFFGSAGSQALVWEPRA